MTELDQLAVFVTSQCTLNCRLCQSCVPEFRERNIVVSEEDDLLFERLQTLFQNVLCRVKSLQITGGEPLSWKPLPALIRRLNTLSMSFDTLRVITNATLLPSEELLNAIGNAEYPIEFYIDNYGSLSTKLDQVTKVLSDKGIPYSVTQYTGDDQHGGGWIDFGDMRQQGGGMTKAAERHANCRFRHGCVGLYDGALYACSVSAMLYLLRGIECDRIEDFQSAAASETIEKWISGDHPFAACEYCNGFDIAHAKRYPAAEQVRIL